MSENSTSECQIELRDIDSIQPYERNPRLNDKAVDAVAASLKEFGFRQPIVVDADGVIIAGHTRWKAAKKLGLAKVPVHVATDLSPEQVRAYRIADNKSAELADWDMEILPIELSELRETGFDLGSLAFSEKELTQLLNLSVGIQQGLSDPDSVPEPPDEAVTKKGDIWILGNHRLMCGDSASPSDLDKLLDGNEIHLCNTDPPYGVKVEPRSNNAIAAGLSSFTNTHHQGFDVERHPEKAQATTKKLRAKDRPLENDFLSDEDFEKLLDAWFGNIARVLQPGRSFYIWGGFTNCGNYPPYLKKHGLYFSQAVIWDKQHPVLTRKDFMTAHEWCFYGWKEGAAHKFFGPNNATDLWAVKKINPTQMVHQNALYWMMVGWESNFTGYLVDYGTWPDQHREYFMLRDCQKTIQHATGGPGLEASIYAALEKLAEERLDRIYFRDDGTEMRIDRCLIDSNWGQTTDVVYQFCRQSIHAAILFPSHGQYVGATSLPFAAHKKQRGDRVGHHWRIPGVVGARAIRHVMIDTNYWKTFVHARLGIPMGDPGCLSLFGHEAKRHRLLAEHLTAEYRVRTMAYSRTVDEWKTRPSRPDNHWFDCLVGCAVAASIQGAELITFQSKNEPSRPRIKLSDRQLHRKML